MSLEHQGLNVYILNVPDDSGIQNAGVVPSAEWSLEGMVCSSDPMEPTTFDGVAAQCAAIGEGTVLAIATPHLPFLHVRFQKSLFSLF